MIFKSSKDGGFSDVPYLNDYDYIDNAWNDSTIKLILPYSVKNIATIEEYCVGSGIIQIAKGNDTIPSTTELNIKYANDSYTATSSSNPANVLLKIPFRQVTFSGSPYNYTNGHSREFYLDTSVSNNPTMKAIVEKSLRDWSCETGINWTIVGTTENHGYVEDGKSVIFLDDALVGDTLGFTKLIGISACYDNSSGESKRFAFAKEIDMGFARIPRNKSWALDTIMTNGIPNNKYDFYEIVMHELGHAHYLGHINKDSDIMFYGSTYGPISATNRRHIFTSPNSIEGGNYIMDRSLAILLDGCENINISKAYHPYYCGTMSSQDLENELFDISAYPNPFNSTVTLTFSNSEILNTNQLDYTITDISGKIIMKSEFKTGSDYKINLSNLNSGIYLLNITNGSNLKRTMKLIKQ